MSLPKNSRGPRVLIIEDDMIVRAILFDIANGVGFDVIEADNSLEAIKLLNEYPDIRLVISDVYMPGGMTGFELAGIIRHRWPGVDVVLTSGLTKIEDMTLPPRTAFVAKPFNRTALIKALGQIESRAAET